MADCKKCDGYGSVECPECMENASNILNGCSHCRGEMIVVCSPCGGSGKEPK
jgi:hypothetical protein